MQLSDSRDFFLIISAKMGTCNKPTILTLWWSFKKLKIYIYIAEKWHKYRWMSKYKHFFVKMSTFIVCFCKYWQSLYLEIERMTYNSVYNTVHSCLLWMFDSEKHNNSKQVEIIGVKLDECVCTFASTVDFMGNQKTWNLFMHSSDQLHCIDKYTKWISHAVNSDVLNRCCWLIPSFLSYLETLLKCYALQNMFH